MRLFAAVYPPADTARALAEAVAALDLPRHRTTPLEQVHLTLHFAGERREDEVAALQGVITELCRTTSVFRLRPEALITLPKRRPRLVAARTHLPEPLAELARRLAARLVGEAERHPRFLPHLTLCRFRRESPAPFERPIEAEDFAVDEVRLVESRLEPSGAVHRTLSRTPLGPVWPGSLNPG